MQIGTTFDSSLNDVFRSPSSGSLQVQYVKVSTSFPARGVPVGHTCLSGGGGYPPLEHVLLSTRA